MAHHSKSFNTIDSVSKHQDDDVVNTGEETAVREDHAEATRDTSAHKEVLKTEREHRNRLNRMMNFWQEQHPDCCQNGVRVLTEEDLGDRDIFWWKNTCDLVHTGLNVKMVLAFMAVAKVKKNGKLAGHADIHRCNDAILWGCSQAGQRLPRNCCVETEKFLKSYKKETAVAETHVQNHGGGTINADSTGHDHPHH